MNIRFASLMELVDLINILDNRFKIKTDLDIKYKMKQTVMMI